MNLNYKEGGLITEHLNKIQSIVNQLSSMKIVLDNELQALLLLSLLPERWETLVVSLSNSALDRVVTMNQVTGNLLNEETRRKSLGSSTPETFVIKKRGEK